MPPFQVPDEIAHFAYAQYVAETAGRHHRRPGAVQYSPEEQDTLDGARLLQRDRPRADARHLHARRRPRRCVTCSRAIPAPCGPGGASSITNQPPLYYALEAIPYWLSPSNDILARLELMRLLSALMAACTVLRDVPLPARADAAHAMGVDASAR